MMTVLAKEVCSHCLKHINIGQSIVECYVCNRVIHTKCYKLSNFESIENDFYCANCKCSAIKKYNPFKSLNSDDDSYNIDNETQKMSNILESCNSYSVHDINESCLDNLKKYMSLFFLNIDGNKSNFDSFTAELERYKHKFPIIGLAETNTDVDVSQVFQISDYNAFYQNTQPGKKKGTGVALYINHSLNVTTIEKASVVTPNLETLFVTISNTQNPITVGVIYRPPNGNDVEALCELSNILQSLPKKKVYIMGDFNINLHNNNKLVHDLEDVTLTTGFSPLISLHTHEKPSCKPTCIDNILTNDIDNVITSGTIKDRLIHHLPIFLIFQCDITCSKNDTKYMQHYDYCNSNVENFVKKLDEQFRCDEPHEFNSFFTTFHTVLDETCKLSKPKCSKRTIRNNPWISSGIIAAVDAKHKLYDTWKKLSKKKCINKHTNDLDRKHCQCYYCKNISEAYDKYKTYRKNLKNVIETAKSSYYGKQILEHQGDSKKTWQVINSLRGKQKRQIKPSFVINNERITNRRVIANEFNKYFVSLASNLNQKYNELGEVEINHIPEFNSYLPKSCSSSIYLHDCTPEEISRIISELQNGKASDIPVHVIKKSSIIISPLLTKYYNHCMQNGIFPDVLKIGRISPIYKKDNEEHLENYRPVSTLAIFGKILEKIIYNRLYSFLTAKNILHENQFGFRKCHSTTHALNYSINHIETALKNKKHVLGIFIDLSKAFDTIDHEKLLHKLNNYGIRGNALQLIKSYLSNRLQYTSVLDSESDKLNVKFGVPQGSVLGPLLFLLYINDICNASDLGNFVLFADDTNIFVIADSKNAVYNKANTIVSSIYNYMRCNLLHINLKKCCHMYFAPKRAPKSNTGDDTDCSLMLSIHGTVIKQVTEAKFLGVTIDDKLSWDHHIKNLNTKLRSCCGRLYRLKNALPKTLHKEIYHTLFESHLAYGISVWGGVSINKLKPLFTAQKKCMRIMFGDTEAFLDKFRTCARSREYGSQILGQEFYEEEHTKPLFTRHDMLTVHNLYRYHCIVETYKVIRLRQPIAIYGLFNRSRRRDDLLITPTPSHNYTYMSASLWNKYRQSSGLQDFTTAICTLKTSLKRSLLDSQKRYDRDTWCDLNFSTFGR
jgi:hypothetical protein